MLFLNKYKKFVLINFWFFLVLLVLYGCSSKYEELDLTMYQYRDTQKLVKFVFDASRFIQENGKEGLDYLRNNRNQFNSENYYLYVYDMNGTNIYHAGMEHLEGKNLLDVTDKNGKEVLQMAYSALKDRDNPHAWIHYSWWEPGKFYSVPKSSCHFIVKTPEGEKLLVGGGINYPHEEREFIRIIVDSAARLVEEKGSEALDEISSPVSKYNYRDVHVFSFDSDGNLLISPAVNSTFAQTNLLDCMDEVRHKPFAKALKELQSVDKVWEVFMSKSRYKRELIKKGLYIRKALMDGTIIYVVAITDLPEPPN